MLRTKLYDFQQQDVRRIHEMDGRCLIANEVGTGKTLESLYYAWRFLPEEPSGPIVVVCPSHLKITWKRQALQHLGMKVEIISGQRCPADKLPPHNPSQTYIINYDVLTPPHWKAGTKPPDDSWLMYLMRQNPRLLICDEAQYCRNTSSARTRGVRLMSARIPHVLMLTGTPLANKPADLWPIINIVNPKLFKSRFDFLTRYTHYKKMWYGWVSKGAKNLDELHTILMRDTMIRRRKQDVLSQLPAVTYSMIPVEIDLREYRKAEANFIQWLYEKSPEMAANAAKAEEITRLNGLKQLAGRLKVDSVIQWTRDLLEETEGKLLLGVVHHSVSGPLMEAFGDRAVKVDGSRNHTQKQAAFDRFNLNPKCDILVGNLQAAGTGWSCASTSDAALCELPWVPSEVEQFIGRLHGIERGIPGVSSHIRFLYAEGTIEEDLCRILETKRTWASQAIDGLDTAGDLDLHSKIRDIIKRRAK